MYIVLSVALLIQDGAARPRPGTSKGGASILRRPLGARPPPQSGGAPQVVDLVDDDDDDDGLQGGGGGGHSTHFP